MTFAQRKLFVLAAWVATVMTVGLIFAIDKPGLWVFVASLAIIPVVFGTWLWEAPEPVVAKAPSRP